MTVVFLHPIGLDGNCWQFITEPRLADAVRYDLLWHGGRPQPAVSLSLAAFAEDVLANVAGPLDLVGVSMGGGIAQQAALRWPDRVRSVVIACSSAGDAIGAGPLERAADTERVGMEGMLESTLRRWFSAETLESGNHPAVAYAQERLLSDNPKSFAAAWRAIAANDAWSQLHLIRTPTTVLHASEDASVSLDRNETMAAGIPDARLKIIPGPHMVHLERPDEFGTAVLEHLDWVSTVETSG